ncbi:hypothetical protein Fmac_024886 [Flemingia macrophylla]|uniref:Uncharacterized protein n=1 Tax=Flemingia macrophylla TaxID=520843 RepID=A0ABD1LQM7_9FABA
MSILRLMLQTSIAGNHSSRGHTLDREDGFQLLAVSVLEMVFSARNDSTVSRGVHDVATDTSAETRKVEGKLDALVNLVTQLAVNQKPASIAKICGIRSSNDHHINRRWLPTPRSFSARNEAIAIRGIHDVATDTSAETRMVEGKLDALVNMVTQLAVNSKPTSVARVCVICSSNDHHTNVCDHSSRGQTLDREYAFQLLVVSVQEMMPLSLEEFTRWLQTHLLKLESSRNVAIAIRGVHDVATDTSTETRKVAGKLDALVKVVTQLAVNQNNLERISILRLMLQTSIAGHHNSRGKTLDREDGFQLLAVSVQETMPLSLKEFTTWLQIHLLKLERGVHDIATDTSAETRKVEGKLDALVNLVTQLAVNQKPASVARSTTAAEARHLIEKMACNS